MAYSLYLCCSAHSYLLEKAKGPSLRSSPTTTGRSLCHIISITGQASRHHVDSTIPTWHSYPSGSLLSVIHMLQQQVFKYFHTLPQASDILGWWELPSQNPTEAIAWNLLHHLWNKWPPVHYMRLYFLTSKIQQFTLPYNDLNHVYLLGPSKFIPTCSLSLPPSSHLGHCLLLKNHFLTAESSYCVCILSRKFCPWVFAQPTFLLV